MNIDRINFFLNYCYFPDYNNKEFKQLLSKINKDLYQNLSEKELSDIFIKELRSSIIKNLNPKKKNLLFLSGGLDSRLILAVLSEIIPPKEIYTLTWGIPGALNFEIGNQIAKKLKTKHNVVNLEKIEYSQEELLTDSQSTSMQTCLFHFIPISILNKYKNRNYLMWNGFFNNIARGSYLLNKKITKEESINNFLSKYRYVKTDKLKLKSSNLKPIIKQPKIENSKISFYEQILINELEEKYTGPHLMPLGFDYATPFFNTSFSNFLLSLDNKLRFRSKFFKENCYQYYPDLFRLPTTTNFGYGLNMGLKIFLSRGSKHYSRISSNFKKIYCKKDLQYFDFNKAFREKEDLKKILIQNINDLSKRKIIYWFNPKQILYDHLNKHGNFAEELITLLSLEIHLKNSKII